MAKDELIKKLEETLQEIPFLEWTKELSLKYLEHLKNEHKKKIIEVNYILPDSDQTAFGIPIESEGIEETKARLKRLPTLEKYFIYIYSLYEGYLETIGDRDKDKGDINLLKYRIFRNVLVHNLGIIKQKDIDEFNKKAKGYNPNLTRREIDRLFGCLEGANVYWDITERDLIKLVDLIKNRTE